jgi:hypothetical protein
MPRPILQPDGVAANLRNKTKHCNIILRGDYLSTNIDHTNVQVWRKSDGVVIPVDSAQASPLDGAWVLILKTKKISALSTVSLTSTDEIEVTVTNPDTSQISEVTDVDVVYYDEE